MNDPYCAYCFGPNNLSLVAGRWYHAECKGKDAPLYEVVPREVGGRGGMVEPLEHVARIGADAE